MGAERSLLLSSIRNVTSLCTHQPHDDVGTEEGGKAPLAQEAGGHSCHQGQLGLKPVVYSGCGDWVVVVTFIGCEA